MRWILPEAADAQLCRSLAEELGIPAFIAEILCRRGFHSTADASRYLDPRLKTLSDPFLLPAMEAAVARILVAIDRRERIVLYGDYDVDGVTSLALFTRVLRAYGGDPQCFLPLRMEEGYGLSQDGATRCVESLHPQLLIAVDCGTSSQAEIAWLQGQGIEVIVFDHHECAGAPPACVAVVNPKLGAGFHYLCSVGLVFKAAHALLKRRPLPGFDLREYLDYVALGTVADLVPLIEENRILTKRGLERLESSRWVGVRALIEVAAVSSPITAGDVGFKLGPRMNAAGRLGAAQAALDLLLTDDPAHAMTLAQDLDAQNRDRRAVEEQVFVEAQAQLAGCFAPDRDAAIVVGALGWHPGVIGIVASRLMKRHHRPTLVVGFAEDGLGKGSGRSIKGLSLVTALAECGHLLEKHGGHEMAAGLTIQVAQFPAFREAFGACARKKLAAEDLAPRLRLDAELKLRDVIVSLLDRHAALEPFGMANSQPMFYARGVDLTGEPRVMKEKHLSFTLRQGNAQARAVWFGGAAETLPRLPWDVAFTVERNDYQGVTSAQIQIRAVRSSGASALL